MCAYPQESESRLNAIIKMSVDGIITIDQQGIVETFNPAAGRLFGYLPEEVIGHNISMLMPEPDHGRHDGYIRNYQQTGEKKIIGTGREVVGLKKNGDTFPFRLSISEVKLKEGTIYTGIIHDISEQKKVEQELSELNEILENKVKERTTELAEVIYDVQRTNKRLTQEIERRKIAEEEARKALAQEVELGEMKSRFVSMASHEFRTPLAGILSSISLVARYADFKESEKGHKHIYRIKSAVRHLTGILNDFLSLDKLNEGKVRCSPLTFDVTELAEELVEELQEIKKKGQTIVHEHKGNSGSIYSDPHILKGALTNLLSNAVKYSPEGKSIQIMTEIDAGKVRIAITDQGIGIPKEDQKHMFQRFFRAQNAANIQGTGLGLTIVKRYVDLLEGTICFDTVENEGTTFAMELPLKLSGSVQEAS